MKRNYLSYLLRVWHTGSEESPNWVASLEDPHSHQVTHFKSLNALLEYLQQSTHLGELGSKPAGGFEDINTKNNRH